MKIGFFTDRYYPQTDGVAVSVDLFAKALHQMGHEVIIFCPQGPEKLPNEPTNIVRFRSAPSIWYEDYRDTFPFTPLSLRKAKSYELDIVHVHTPGMIGMLGIRIAREYGLPLVATHHTDIEQYIKVYKRIMAGFVAVLFLAPALMKASKAYPESLRSLKPQRSARSWNRHVIRHNVKLFYDFCDVVIAPSPKIATLLHGYGLSSPVEVLPTGIDTTENIPDWDMRKHLKLNKDDLILVYVGRLGEEKNLSLTISALPAVIKTIPNTHLVLVGDGPYSGELKQLTNDLALDEHVHMLGMLPHAKALAAMKASDIFVFPSTTDTQGLVLNEAAWVGLPLIWCDDNISTVTTNHRTGLLSNSNRNDLAKNILYLAQHHNLREQMSSESHQAAQKITIKEQAEKLLTIYSKLR